MANVVYPRVIISYCTQCKWNLRAAWYAQELLQTFSATMGEVAMRSSTGGVFTVEMQHLDPSVVHSGSAAAVQSTMLWDRKIEGGFPDSKDLKKRVRDVIEPGRDLGHVDGKKIKKDEKAEATETAKAAEACGSKEVCEDCQ